MFRVCEVSHSYGSGPALRGVSLRIAPGTVMGLIGPNGSGKTTLLKTLYGAVGPDRGVVEFEGRDVRRIPPRDRARRIAVVVQDPDRSDVDQTVADTVLLGRTPHLGLFPRLTRRDQEAALSALRRVGAAHLSQRGMAELSGGERQRVLVARALAQDARCLLLDEPTNHLDVGAQHELMGLIRSLGLTTVVVLHDLNLAVRYCDEAALLVRGRMLRSGPPAEVLASPVIDEVYGVHSQPVLASDGVPQLLFGGGDSLSA